MYGTNYFHKLQYWTTYLKPEGLNVNMFQPE
jgi:hypothetical protein